VALTKERCPCCNEHHPADEGITVFYRMFVCLCTVESRGCGIFWEDEWCSNCNDKCPECGKEIEPLDDVVEKVIEEAVYA
jgi:hypothetical protein